MCNYFGLVNCCLVGFGYFGDFVIAVFVYVGFWFKLLCFVGLVILAYCTWILGSGTFVCCVALSVGFVI